jgi:hypothetical protein
MSNNTQAWKSKQLTHEGFPLLLRYPGNMDFDFHKDVFPNLAVITHEFSKVNSNGLPEAEYNDSLLQFDTDVRSAFEKREVGQTVLIETFGGKRNYYIYVGTEIDVGKIISDVSEKYPQVNISWLSRPDSEWGFIKQYSEKFLE